MRGAPASAHAQDSRRGPSPRSPKSAAGLLALRLGQPAWGQSLDAGEISPVFLKLNFYCETIPDTFKSKKSHRETPRPIFSVSPEKLQNDILQTIVQRRSRGRHATSMLGGDSDVPTGFKLPVHICSCARARLNPDFVTRVGQRAGRPRPSRKPLAPRNRELPC